MPNKHECLLCKRDMRNSSKIFGAGCIKHTYQLLNLSMPRTQKENFLYETIMKKRKIKNLNKNQKIWLTDRYLTNEYLLKVDYGNFAKIQQEINKDIENVERVSKFEELKTSAKFSLKQAYEMYKRAKKFKESLEKLKKMDIRDEETQKFIKANFSYIFHMYKNRTQYENDSFKAMQYAFWQTVVEGGREVAGFIFSADLLQHSLEEKADDIVITEGKEIDIIKADESFKNVINKIIEKYGTNTDEFVFDSAEQLDNEEKIIIEFKDKDLYYSIHKADLIVKGKKEESKWNLEIILDDQYDYTVPKKIKDYYYDTENVAKSIFSSTLYNLASFSVKVGVMKEFHITIKYNWNEYEVM